ncbi:MAG: Carbamoylphosphate synthase large subunit [Candidatus Ozemobacter sibiricus]|jgi:hypothetical protein|uniref:Carbamoylphosphate synthase large subunit n=1 Tax=Candidatus Ozemobacter sibiricus TaxID=2268124 RepID=A0A367ZT31_9BACT|nr:MAG: Carbamoylphosphate synthase large subunit [Candidatus Ozemobacter sibiricus]
MNVVFLSPHFPTNFYNFACALSRAGARVLGLADVPYDCLRPRLREALTEYYQVGNLEHYDEVMRACGYFIHHHGRLDRVESHNEHWLGLEARLREDFNIPGPRPADLEKIKRKSVMKDYFRRAGVPVAEGALVRTEAEAWAFADKVGYPVFAKPDIGVGAASTYKIENVRQMEEFLKTRPPVDYFLEEFVDGRLATFDGLCDGEGKVVYCVSHFSETGCYELVAYDVDLSYYSLREMPPDLREAGTKVVEAFGIREKFFHLEFLRRRSDGALRPLELNCRPPGGFTTDLMNFSSDIDVYQMWADLVVHGRRPTGPIEMKYHAAHVARRRHKRYRLSHDEILARFGHRIVMFEEIPSLLAGVMGDFSYIVRSPDLEEIKYLIREIQALA